MLKSLLHQHDRIYGAICRDVTATDIELMSQIGLHVVWFDLEHGPQTMADAVSLGRLATHLGMVPLVRIPELSRTYVQVLLDGGIRIVVVPDIRSAQQARDLVELGKYPPVGRRGLSSTIAGQGFQMTDPQRDLERENEDVQLMVMIESDEAYDQLDEIVAVDGLDMVSVGPSDWSTSLGLFGDEAKRIQTPKIDRVIEASVNAGKIVAMNASSLDEADHYYDLGARVLFVGVDIAVKRRAWTETLDRVRGSRSA